jgi:hypothetical protein
MTQMSYALDGVGGRRNRNPACYQTTSEILRVDPSPPTGSARVGNYAGKLVMLPFY